MTLDFFKLDSYFHMVNHYKKIRNAKSVIDCSLPKGYDNQCQYGQYRTVRTPQCAGPHSPYTRNYKPGCSHVPDYCSSEHYRSLCPKFEPRRACSAPPRKRLIYEGGAPEKQKNTASRPRSLEPTVTKMPLRNFMEKRNVQQHNVKTPKKKAKQSPKADKSSTKLESPKTNDSPAGSRKVKSNEDVPVVNKKNREPPVNTVEDSEYLHFLLGITEDILRNNMYTNSGMDRVFESHLEANRGRLDEARMKEQIEQLKKELNYPLKKPIESMESICMCDKEIETPSGDCKCWPHHTNPETNSPFKCINPDCPGHTHTETEISNDSYAPNKTEAVEERNLGGGEQNQQMTVTSASEHSHTNVNLEEEESSSVDSTCGLAEGVCKMRPKKIEEEKANIVMDPKECVDPSNCNVPMMVQTSSKKSVAVSEKNTVFYEKDDDSSLRPPDNSLSRESRAVSVATSKRSSVVKIVNKDSNINRRLSQIVFYNPEVGELCHCTISLRKTALKIQLDEQDENEEYILVDGPVCMPKTMLEEQTVPVMIENVSSVLIDSDFEIFDEGSSSAPSASRVNLFQCSANTLNVEGQPDSVSVQIAGLVKEKMIEAECDMTPERDLVSEQEDLKSSGEQEVSSLFRRRSVPLRLDSAVVKESPTVSKTLMTESTKPSGDSVETAPIPKKRPSEMDDEAKTTSPVDLNFGVIKDGDLSQLEMESKRPSFFDGHFDEDFQNHRLGDTSPSSEAKLQSEEKKSTDTPDAVQSSSKSNLKSIESDLDDEAELSDESNPSISDRLKQPIEHPSERRSSDFGNKYHYLLQDATTSISSTDLRRAEAYAMQPPPPPPPFYQKRRESILQQGDATFQQRDALVQQRQSILLPESGVPYQGRRQSCLLPEDEYRLTQSIVEIQPIVPLQQEQSVNLGSSDTDDDEKRNLPKVFKYTTRGPMRTLETMYPKTGKKHFEYAYKRKLDDESIDHISDIASFTRPFDADDTEDSLIRDRYGSFAGLSSLNSSDLGSRMERTSSDQLEKRSAASESSVPSQKQEVPKVRYSSNEEFDHQSIIKKLDDIPEPEFTPAQQQTLDAITRKLQEFRTIDPNDATKKFKYINPDDNFEIRRQSLTEENSERDDNIRKPKPTCCGFVQHQKSKKIIPNGRVSSKNL